MVSERPTVRGGTRAISAVMFVVGLVVAASCGSSSSSPDRAGDDAQADAMDTSVPNEASLPEASTDSRFDGGAACGDACDLTCSPDATWFAVAKGPGRASGDPEPASPQEVGDGLWHLFMGVDLTTDGGVTYVLVYDSTATAPDAPFQLADQPLNSTNDAYDIHGKETPSYLRFDTHTEYVYYTADTSYGPPIDPTPLQASVAALKRVDGGPWTKVGLVAPFATGESVEIDPTVALDPSTGQLVLLYESLQASDGGADQLGIVSRTSVDPESFDPSTRQWITSGPQTAGSIAPARVALSHDDVAGVWRVAFDMADYPSGGYAYQTLQAWSPTAIPAATTLSDAAPFLHDANHDLHQSLHLDGRTCEAPGEDAGAFCPQGAVLQPSKAIYPDGGDVIFYYAGWSTLPGLQINGQRCTRTR